MSALSGRRVLVTGAAGFLGSHLVPRLVDAGASVFALDRPGARCWDLIEKAGLTGAVRGDVASLAERTHDRVLDAIDTIVHLAAVGVVGEVSDVRELVHGNVDGTMAVLVAAQRWRARVAYCGSCFEYGSGANWSEDALPAPTSEYGAAKAAGWMLANAFAHRTGVEVVSLRPFTMYGPHEPPGRLIPSVVRQALVGKPIELTPGDQVRDFVFVEDVADAFVAAAAVATGTRGTFNVCSGTAFTVRDVVRKVLAATGSESEARFGALSYRPTELPVLTGDPTSAARTLGWRARTSLDDGLARTIAWFRDVGVELPEYQVQ